jgi:aspartate dehydrogenase
MLTHHFRAAGPCIALTARLTELAGEFAFRVIGTRDKRPITAAAQGEIQSVKMVTRKPVKGLLGAPFLTENNIRIEDIKEPTRIFSGTPREAAMGFPANLNVAVALGLAGIGVDRTTLDIWADPTIDRNTHSVEVVSDSASFTMTIVGIPSENPKTGRITALSVLAYLRKMNAPLRVGS